MKSIFATIIAVLVIAPAAFADAAKPCCEKEKAAACCDKDKSAAKFCPKQREALLTHKGNSLAKR